MNEILILLMNPFLRNFNDTTEFHFQKQLLTIIQFLGFGVHDILLGFPCVALFYQHQFVLSTKPSIWV